MKKTSINIIKARKILFNGTGQVLFTKAYSSPLSKKFFQFILKQGS